MTYASELSPLESLEKDLHADVSVRALAAVERELLRLRSELTAEEWIEFCEEFPKRPIFNVLRLGNLVKRRKGNDGAGCPADLLDVVISNAFHSRPAVTLTPSQILNAWEDSLPSSRSVRAREKYFSREIAEVIGTAIKPRILILRGGRLREADNALHNADPHTVQFVVFEQDSNDSSPLRSSYRRESIQLETGTWSDLMHLGARMGRFDLIYSPSGLDSSDDSEALLWLAAGVEMLRSGGRLLAANFTPDSRDAGWVEACWNWHPHYRSEEDLARLILKLRCASMRGHTVFRDESGASAFIEIHSL